MRTTSEVDDDIDRYAMALHTLSARARVTS